MRVEIASPACCSLNGLLYVIGGMSDEDSNQYQDVINNLVQCYNPATDTWEELASMSIPRVGCGVCSFNGYLYVIGGFTNEISKTVEYYDPVNDKWHKCKDMNEKRHRPGVAVLNNRLYVCGGEEDTNLFHDSIECYDSIINEWATCANMNSGRSWLSCATLRLHNPLLDTELNGSLD
jgi:N-acetylneuraminic acid mutarotase